MVQSKTSIASAASSEYMYQAEDSAMSGYLYKKTRDDRWQKRWFETNGVYLTYYKSRKMEKLLAALSLPQVGEIKVGSPEEDPENQAGLFTLELNTRIYTLRAKNDAEALLWVNALNKLRADGLSFSSVGGGSTVGTSSAVGGKPEASRSSSALEVSQTRGASAAEKPQTDWVKSGKSWAPCC